MKKSKILLAVGLGVMVLATGCKKSDNNEYSKYVKSLGEYKGIEVKMDSTEVTDEEVTNAVNSELQAKATNEEVKDRAVKNGDIVNIDYKGTKDGKEFEGGSAQGYDLTIGSGAFIPGFEDQLVGKNKGDKVEVKVTFPEEYQSEDLAGKDAKFDVTINKISEQVVPKLTDKWVKDNTEYKTVKEYKENTKTNLVKQKEETAKTNKTANILTTIMENSEITGYPQDELDAYKEDMKNYYKSYAQAFGVELTDFVSGYLKMTEEQFEEECNKMAKETIGRQMLCKMIADKENITISDEEYKAGIEKYAKQYNKTTEEFEKEYEKDVVTNNLLYEKVLNFVTENAVEK